MSEKSLEERVVNLEFIVQQLSEKVNLYMPYITELQNMSKFSNELDSLKDKYGKISQSCAREKVSSSETKRHIEEIVERVNSFHSHQVDLIKDVVKISTELEQVRKDVCDVKKDLDSINEFIKNLNAGAWRIIERLGPLVVIVIYVLWQFVEGR